MKVVLMKVLLLALMVAMVVEYMRWALEHPQFVREIVFGLNERPYVYRALVPFLARVLTWMGLQPGIALVIVVILSSLGLVYGLIYFFKSVEG